jgi:hypothetical protein
MQLLMALLAAAIGVAILVTCADVCSPAFPMEGVLWCITQPPS